MKIQHEQRLQDFSQGVRFIQHRDHNGDHVLNPLQFNIYARLHDLLQFVEHKSA